VTNSVTRDPRDSQEIFDVFPDFELVSETVVFVGTLRGVETLFDNTAGPIQLLLRAPSVMACFSLTYLRRSLPASNLNYTSSRTTMPTKPRLSLGEWEVNEDGEEFFPLEPKLCLFRRWPFDQDAGWVCSRLFLTRCHPRAIPQGNHANLFTRVREVLL